MQEENSISTIDIDATWNKRPLIISGPCSAETETQLLDTSLRLRATGKVDILRAGIWKPRTRPGNFEGVGAIGLPWLQQARRLTGLPVMVEVANAAQVEAALKHDIDIFWIGARTTVNPFSIQEVADALKGVHIPVFIKNPINPDLELWIGAVERIAVAGIERIALIHRGFSSYGNKRFRNAPMWHLAIEMKRLFSSLPFIIDPSHICGNRILLAEVAQHAVDLHYEGVMIEAHADPDDAWSDAAQQITPESLSALLDGIVWRTEDITSEDLHKKLKQFRNEINHLDDKVLELLADRMRIAEEIGKYKKDHDITILQTSRWNEILERLSQRCSMLGLSEHFIKQYFEVIHLESIRHQDMVMNKK